MKIQNIILLINDGLGDRPIKQLGGLTPLEAAKTPHYDQLASESECGIMYALGRGYVPGSDVAHLAILGYEPDKFYTGRGPIEAAGINMNLHPGDVALRCDLGTVDEHLVIKDRRAGRIKNVKPLTDSLNGIEIDGVRFMVKHGTAHRAGLVLRGEYISSDITDGDPHVPGVPVQTILHREYTPQAKKTADVLNKFLKKAHKILKDHPYNKERENQGKLPANWLLVRGAGQFRTLPKFRERYGLSACCIAGTGLYKGIGEITGMKVLNVEGATGLPNTDIEAKFKAAINNLDHFKFFFIHVKASDSLGEDGDIEGKVKFIEKLDRALQLFMDLPEETLIIITADHSTPCELKSHSGDPVPILFYGPGVRIDDVSTFGERSCAKGGLGVMEGKDIMSQVQNLMGVLVLSGS